MTIDEENKKYWAELLKEIYPECHNCKHLIEADYLDADGNDCTGLICDEEHNGLIFIDRDDPRPPCKYREEVETDQKEKKNDTTRDTIQTWIDQYSREIFKRNIIEAGLPYKTVKEMILEEEDIMVGFKYLVADFIWSIKSPYGIDKKQIIKFMETIENVSYEKGVEHALETILEDLVNDNLIAIHNDKIFLKSEEKWEEYLEEEDMMKDMMKDVVCKGITQYMNKYSDYKKEKEKLCKEIDELEEEMVLTENKVEDLYTDLSVITEIPKEEISVYAYENEIKISIKDKTQLIDVFKELSKELDEDKMEISCHINKGQIVITKC